MFGDDGGTQSLNNCWLHVFNSALDCWVYVEACPFCASPVNSKVCVSAHVRIGMQKCL